MANIFNTPVWVASRPSLVLPSRWAIQTDRFSCKSDSLINSDTIQEFSRSSRTGNPLKTKKFRVSLESAKRIGFFTKLSPIAEVVNIIPWLYREKFNKEVSKIISLWLDTNK